MDDCYQVNMRWNLTFRFGSPFIEGLTLESLLKPAPEWAALHPQPIYIPPRMGNSLLHETAQFIFRCLNC